MRKPKQIWICSSPKAGSGQGREQVVALRDLAEREGVTANLSESIEQLRERMTPFAGTESRGDFVVVAAGGDGTAALVAANLPPQIPLVPMPMGTENLLAHHFGFSRRAERVLETIFFGEDRQLDAGEANGRMFLVMATAGFDAEVVRATHLRRRGHIRRLAYAGPIARAVRRYRFPEIAISFEMNESDGQRFSEPVFCRWGMVFNLPRYGGQLGIEPEAIGDDGLLDAIAFRQGSIFSGLRYLAAIKTGRHLRFSDVVRTRTRALRLTSATRVPYQLDGDYVGRLPVEIRCLPHRVRLRLPRVA